MTPSDSIDIKQGSLPASVSSASSLDSMHQASRLERYIPSDVGSQGNDTQQIENASTNPRGDNEGAESQNASRPQHHQGVISPSASAAMPSATSITLPSMMLSSNHLGIPVLPSGTPLTMPGTAGNNSIPEFLYQLTKMLTDNNRHIIEWTNGEYYVCNTPINSAPPHNISHPVFTFKQEKSKCTVPIDWRAKSCINTFATPSLLHFRDS
eukprot:scaffold190_cov171-Amphora_coffeaeformis.AAC.22